MATCNPTTLMAEAECFTGLTDGQRKLVIIALLMLWQGGSLTPATLMSEAACFTGLTDGQRHVVKAQLLCDILGGLA